MKRKLTFDIDGKGCYIPTSHKAKAVHGKHVSGRINRNGSSMSFARWIYKEMFGEIPDDVVIRHSCDNGLCIAPHHMKIGTQADNMRDMIERGRNTNGPRILDEFKVLDIRKQLAAGKTVREMADVYGVAVTTIQDVKYCRTWKPESVERRIQAMQGQL